MTSMPKLTAHFTGITLMGQGSSEKGDWTRHKLSLKNNMSDEKSFSMTVFSPLRAKNSKQPDQLKTGQEYSFLYKENTFTDQFGNEKMAKTCIGIYDTSEEDDEKIIEENQKAQVINLSAFPEFAENYVKLMKEKNYSINTSHMMGSYLSTYYSDIVKELREACSKIVEKSK